MTSLNYVQFNLSLFQEIASFQRSKTYEQEWRYKRGSITIITIIITLDVTDSVPVRVLEAPGVDVVYNACVPPM